jgi:hypothetical protein
VLSFANNMDNKVLLQTPNTKFDRTTRFCPEPNTKFWIVCGPDTMHANGQMDLLIVHSRKLKLNSMV